MSKRLYSLILAVFLALSLCSCDFLSFNGIGQQTSDATGNDPIVGDGTSYTGFISVMSEIKSRGDAVSNMGLSVNSEYYYSFAGASLSAFRYAVEYILWLKGEGDTLASFTSGSRYSGFDTIAEIKYSSPYPAYFEGLLYEVQGEYDKAIDSYAWASIMPMFPEEGLDFYYLKKAEVSKLYELRDTLREAEESVYSLFTPVLTGREWDRTMFDAEYLVGKSSESVKSSDYESALYYAIQGLRVDPFDELVWQNAAVCAIFTGDFVLAGEYIDEASAMFPDNEKLAQIKQAMIDAIEKEGQ